MTTTHRRPHSLTRIALVTAVAIFSAGGYLSASGIDDRLIDAAGYGEVAMVELLLDRGADIEARDDDGETALMAASEEGHDEVAAVLRAWVAKHRPRR